MAAKVAITRLRKEYKAFMQDPPEFVSAHPFETDVLEWRFVIRGPPDSPYEGGEYMGKLKFPDQYPFKPPAIMMLTPNGRFETDRRLCLSMSDFHPETWCPAWSVSTIVKGVLSFMLEQEQTTGAIVTTDDQKKLFARASHEWNLKHKDYLLLFKAEAEAAAASAQVAPSVAPAAAESSAAGKA
mmetsp:Transcript_36024/g.89932  ORF Transcript_36024/g.89932 Transcript_36024/m.89932 type:complete len:184 (-) Transcript_36024:216-767(-)